MTTLVQMPFPCVLQTFGRGLGAPKGGSLEQEVAFENWLPPFSWCLEILNFTVFKGALRAQGKVEVEVQLK